MLDHYNKDGEPIDLMTWAMLSEMPEYKRVKQDRLEDGTYISTVWLGIDHGYDRPEGSPPLIFETMVFNPTGDDIFCERYATEQEAMDGHQLTVETFKIIKNTASSEHGEEDES